MGCKFSNFRTGKCQIYSVGDSIWVDDKGVCLVEEDPEPDCDQFEDENDDEDDFKNNGDFEEDDDDDDDWLEQELKQYDDDEAKWLNVFKDE